MYSNFSEFNNDIINEIMLISGNDLDAKTVYMLRSQHRFNLFLRDLHNKYKTPLDAIRAGKPNIALYFYIEQIQGYTHAYNRRDALEAAKRGYKKLIKYFIDKQGENNFNNIAEIAAEYGHINIVKNMIRRGANDFNEITINAARGGHMDIVEYMIDLGADEFDTIAQSAAKGGHRDIVKYMIDLGANEWNEIAFVAASEGYRDIVQDMIDFGADKFNEIARYAAYDGHMDIVQDMIRRGARVNIY
jgi:ankyrin repeat protein